MPANFDTKAELNLVTITWNLANREPSDADIDIIVTQIRLMQCDAIIISTQEEPRDHKKTLAYKLNEKLGMTLHSGHSFETQTGVKPSDCGRVAGQVLTPKDVETSVSDRRSVLHSSSVVRRANKGGVTFKLALTKGENEFIVRPACVHLDSYSENARREEMMRLMQHSDGGGFTSWDDFETSAEDIVIFAGDVNYRITAPLSLCNGDRDFNELDDTPHSLNQLERLHGLRDADENGGKCKEETTTYVAKHKRVDTDPRLALSVDKCRAVVSEEDGKTMACLSGGRLDRVYTRRSLSSSASKDRHIVIQGTETSDHRPVIASTSVSCCDDSFLRAKHKLVNIITSVNAFLSIDSNVDALSQHVLSQENDKKGQAYLELVLNYYLQMRQLCHLQESLRLQAKKEKSKAVKELVSEHLKAGNQLFSNPANMSNPACRCDFLSGFEQRTNSAVKDDSLLVSHSGLFSSLIGFVTRSFYRYVLRSSKSVMQTRSQSTISSIMSPVKTSYKGWLGATGSDRVMLQVKSTRVN